MKRSVLVLLAAIAILVAAPASAKTWKSGAKIDPNASKAAMQAMNASLSSGSITRSKDKDNSFSTYGQSKVSGNNLSGEWGVDLLLGKKRSKKSREISIGWNPKENSLSLDYDAMSVDVLFPVLWGICGPKVGMNGGLGGSVTTVKSKKVPTFYVYAGCDGQVGCGVVAPRCKVAFIGGGIYGRGEAGVKTCTSGSCMNSYISGQFGPTFEVSAACERITLFSWKDNWVQKEKILKTVNY